MASRNEVRDGRHYKNPFDDYNESANDGIINENKDDITESFKSLLIAKAKEFVAELDKNKSEWYNCGDCSMYTGLGGLAQMFHRLGTVLNDQSYSAKSLELVKKSLQEGRGDRCITYIIGSPGPLALNAVIHSFAGDEATAQKMILKLSTFASRAVTETANELLYGKVGYLYALLYINANVPGRPIQAELIKQIIDQVLKTGRDYAKSLHCESPLMYQWHETEYLGGAHGLGGILYILLQAREYLAEAQLQNDIKPSLDYLEKLRFKSGNFPSSLGNNSDKLVHWCHGAPSMSMLFVTGYKIFKKDSYLQTAIECGEVVWTRGLLKKGYSLCHGVSGNAYTFICLYQQTGDAKHLYRACKFAEWCMSYGKNCERNPDRPFSLFEGLAGVIYFLVDLCKPKLAKFPAYTL